MESADRVTLRIEEPDDSSLVARLRAGEEAAFAELVRQQTGRLLAVARHFLPNEEDARDAVQDAFLSAFKALEGFDGTARLGTWLHRIVVNAALTKLRTRRRKPERSIDELLPKFLDDGHMDHPATIWQETSAAALERQETRAVIRRCIDDLPEIYRNVLLLRDIEEMDTDLTAQLLGVSSNVVKTRLHRARQALRALLDPYLRGDPS